VPAGLRERFPGPALMAVVNVTPDSFSDGGAFADEDAAVAEGLRHAGAGAAIVDVGGESTRPRSVPVSTAEELRRVVGVIERLRAGSAVPISIDTSKAEVARRALGAGASFVNDVTALRGDPEMPAVVAAAGCDLCLMHMLGTPQTMQDDPRYDDVVAEVGDFLGERAAVAVAAGVERERICVDPGIGFGKTVEHNAALIAGIAEIEERAGAPVLIGVSRKSFLGRLVGDLGRDRTLPSVVAAVAAVARGAWMLRVHDVEPHRDALRVWAAVGSAAR
jgi:dihydropteroate synthase